MDHTLIELENRWRQVLSSEFSRQYFQVISSTLHNLKQIRTIVYPSEELIFDAFNKTPFDNVKVVIVGQDPYHGEGEAMGLSFSVPKDKTIPPSLRNIYKELHTDLSIEIPQHGDLTKWAEQGVLLLNTILTVEHKKAASHRKLGWEQFTNAAIKALSSKRENLVFLLWGNYAQTKKEFIDQSRHTVLIAPHPSPLARGGFFNCKHFSKTNTILKSNNIAPIDWKVD